MVTVGLSFDVEDPLDATLMRGAGGTSGGLDAGVDALLQRLSDRGARATFFLLVSVVARYPELARRIAEAGHEVACHGLTHDLLHELGEQRVRVELGRARAALQEASGQQVTGYRAPTWSLGRKTPWAVDVLMELGFRYDSSVFPMWAWLYGEPGAPRRPYRIGGIGGAELLELPPACARMGALSVPVAGGIYWRVLPPGLTLRLLPSLPVPVLYLHPWEIDRAFRCPPGTPPWVRLAMTAGRRRAERTLEGVLGQAKAVALGTLADELDAAALPLWALTPSGLRCKAVRAPAD